LDFAKLPAKDVSDLEKCIEIKILFPDHCQPISCLPVNVLIINHTDSLASFFDDEYLWGYYNLSFKLAGVDANYIIHKKDRDFLKNIPAYKTLFPGDTLLLNYTLDFGHCGLSAFHPIGQGKPLRTLQAVYKLDKETLESARLQGEIKYKQIFSPDADSNGRHRKGKLTIIDSLKSPVEINRTFPLSRLESKEYNFD
jgi:hypothetical protein